MSKEFNTESYAREIVKATDISESGMEMIFEGIGINHSEEYGDFNVIYANANGRKITIRFNSEKLAGLVNEHSAEMMNKKIVISGFGSGINRNYKVKLL